MSDSIYFVVLKSQKGIYATKYRDHLPSDKYSRNPSFVRVLLAFHVTRGNFTPCAGGHGPTSPEPGRADLAWRRDNHSPVLAQFVQTALAQASGSGRPLSE